MLENEELSFNTRNALLYAIEEKRVMHSQIEDSNTIFDFLLMNPEDTITMLKYGKLDEDFRRYHLEIPRTLDFIIMAD